MATPMHNEHGPLSTPRGHGASTAGTMLITLGLFLLAAQYLQSETLALFFLPGLGLIFLVGGLSTRNVGLIVPGSILVGLGSGIYLAAGPLAYLSEEATAGVILLGLASGFGLITVLASAMTLRLHWWPLIPAGILSLVAGTLQLGAQGIEILIWTARVWPVALIIAGALLVLRRRE